MLMHYLSELEINFASFCKVKAMLLLANIKLSTRLYVAIFSS